MCVKHSYSRCHTSRMAWLSRSLKAVSYCATSSAFACSPISMRKSPAVGIGVSVYEKRNFLASSSGAGYSSRSNKSPSWNAPADISVGYTFINTSTKRSNSAFLSSSVRLYPPLNKFSIVTMRGPESDQGIVCLVFHKRDDAA